MEPVQFLRVLIEITLQNARYKNMPNRRDMKILLLNL